MAARHGYYTPVTPLEYPTNSFVEIASALIHDCLVGIQRGGTAFSNRGTLVSLCIQSADLQEQRCLSHLAELREIFDGREVLDQLRRALRRVSEEWNRELAWRGHIRRRDFDLQFNEFVREVRQRLDDPNALRGHQDRIRAFLGVRTRVCISNGARSGDRWEAAILYDTLQGLDTLLHGRHNHGNILPRLISLDKDNSYSEELVIARDQSESSLSRSWQRGPWADSFGNDKSWDSCASRLRSVKGRLWMRLMRRVVLYDESCKRPSQLPAHSRRHLPADATILHLIGRITISTIYTGVTIPLRAGSTVDERRHALNLAVHNPRQRQHLQLYRQLCRTTRPSIPVSPDTLILSPPSALSFRHTHLILQMDDLFIGHDRHLVQS
ncbi:hypothetical protein ARMGADRAFT_1078223 [Armillaria gallica]|uniref:Uncharacterized protein n=1 Tax=Armillaria gallica TaxID=47427 RepID=A0A2H3E2G0_ARMGA|nr:hypothetical protein ARMGADRAFT_1078223 [Armillaria gallica]